MTTQITTVQQPTQTLSTGISTGQAASPDITYLKTGEFSSIQWYMAEADTVREFRDDITKMTMQLIKGNTDALWSSIIVV